MLKIDLNEEKLWSMSGMKINSKVIWKNMD
jgi:hypothetical protein